MEISYHASRVYFILLNTKSLIPCSVHDMVAYWQWVGRRQLSGRGCRDMVKVGCSAVLLLVAECVLVREIRGTSSSFRAKCVCITCSG
jgi:hypothetical protein